MRRRFPPRPDSDGALQLEMDFLACESALAAAEADVLQARLRRAYRAQEQMKVELTRAAEQALSLAAPHGTREVRACGRSVPVRYWRRWCRAVTVGQSKRVLERWRCHTAGLRVEHTQITGLHWRWVVQCTRSALHSWRSLRTAQLAQMVQLADAEVHWFHFQATRTLQTWRSVARGSSDRGLGNLGEAACSVPRVCLGEAITDSDTAASSARGTTQLPLPSISSVQQTMKSNAQRNIACHFGHSYPGSSTGHYQQVACLHGSVPSPKPAHHTRGGVDIQHSRALLYWPRAPYLAASQYGHCRGGVSSPPASTAVDSEVIVWWWEKVNRIHLTLSLTIYPADVLFPARWLPRRRSWCGCD